MPSSSATFLWLGGACGLDRLLSVSSHDFTDTIDNRREGLVGIGDRTQRLIGCDAEGLGLVAHGELHDAFVHLLAQEQPDGRVLILVPDKRIKRGKVEFKLTKI